MILRYSFIKICQSLTEKGDWQTGNLKLAGDRKARLIVANTGGGHSTALRVYERKVLPATQGNRTAHKMDQVLENPILTFDVLREQLGGVRVDTEDSSTADKDTLYLFHAHRNSDASVQQEIEILTLLMVEVLAFLESHGDEARWARPMGKPKRPHAKVRLVCFAFARNSSQRRLCAPLPKASTPGGKYE